MVRVYPTFKGSLALAGLIASIGARRTMIRSWGGDENLTKSDYLKASTIAGAFAGFVGGSLRNAVSGRGHVLPGVIVWSLAGDGGQVFADHLASSTPTSEKKSWFDSKWSPLRVLPDEEYRNMLEEKKLKLDAEIALIDDLIAQVRAKHQQSDDGVDDRKP